MKFIFVERSCLRFGCCLGSISFSLSLLVGRFAFCLPCGEFVLSCCFAVQSLSFGFYFALVVICVLRLLLGLSVAVHVFILS